MVIKVVKEKINKVPIKLNSINEESKHKQIKMTIFILLNIIYDYINIYYYFVLYYIILLIMLYYQLSYYYKYYKILNICND